MSRLGLVVFVSSSLTACSLINAPAEEVPGTTTGGEATTSGADGGGGPSCDPKECPGEDNDCETRVCKDDKCGIDFAKQGTKIAKQTKGDCKTVVCDGQGKTIEESDDNDAGTTDDCFLVTCSEGIPTKTPAPAWTECTKNGGTYCDDKSHCMACADPGDDCFSTGKEGAFNATADTTLEGGVHNFTTFNIDSAVTVTVTGNDPLVIRTRGDVTLQGVLDLRGGGGADAVTFMSGGVGGIAVAGGANGGDGLFVVDGGPNDGSSGFGLGAGLAGTGWCGGSGAGFGTDGAIPEGCDTILGGSAYSDAKLTKFAGGSGAGSGSYGNNCGGGGGGAGGGAVKIYAFGTLIIGQSGWIKADGGAGGTDGGGSCGGGGGGSGGAIWLRALSLQFDTFAFLTASGGSSGSGSSAGGAGGDGRIRLDHGKPFNANGQISPATGFEGGLWYK